MKVAGLRFTPLAYWVFFFAQSTTAFLISNFRRVLMNVVCFLLGNSPASAFYMPTFRNTISSIFIGG